MRRSLVGRLLRHPSSWALLIATGITLASPAEAQIAGSISVESDYRYRSRSLSSGHPVVTANLDYDDKSGFFIDGSITAMLSGERPGVLGVQGNIGYATRLSSKLSIDVGVLRSQYMASYAGDRAAHYTELYLGLTRRRVSSRVYFSPDYFHSGISTLYGEIEGVIDPAKDWHLTAHVGGLIYLSRPTPYGNRRDQHDWRLGVSRQLGAFEVHLNLSGGGPGSDYYGSEPHGRTALVVGATRSF
ncbi:MAG: TorF family putative porin [Sphingomonas sp.]